MNSKSRFGINIAFSFFMALTFQAINAQEHISYEPAPLSLNQKFLLNVARYHMSKNDKILASLVVLVPLVVLAAQVSPWFMAAPLVAPASSTMVNNYLATAGHMLPDPAVEIPAAIVNQDTMSHLEELVPLISYDQPQTQSSENDTLSLGRSVGAFSAGAGTVTALIWYVLGK